MNNIIETIKKTITPNTETRAKAVASLDKLRANNAAATAEARTKLDDASRAEYLARVKCAAENYVDTTELDESTKRKRVAQLRLEDAEAVERDLAKQETRPDFIAKLTRLEALIEKSSNEAFPVLVADELPIIIAAEKAICEARTRILDAIKQQHLARVEADAIARDLGIGVKFDPQMLEGNAVGLVSRALARAKTERGEGRLDEVGAWVKCAWGEVAEGVPAWDAQYRKEA